MKNSFLLLLIMSLMFSFEESLHMENSIPSENNNSRSCSDLEYNALTNSISAMHSHNLAITPDGGVVAWGRNTHGQSDVPEGLSDVVKVDAGSYHSVALHSDGTISAWGRNNHGQTNVPADLPEVIDIAGGGNHTLVLHADGTVSAWGRNNNGGQSTVPDGLAPAV